MAAISGDQKQKLYVLAGFLGVLVLVGFLVMRTRSAPDESAAAPAITTAGAPVSPQVVTVKPTVAQIVKIVKVTEKKTAKAALVKAPVILVAKSAYVEPSRPDPFEPFYHPTPEPTVTPTPLPPPVELPLPPASVPLPALRLASSPPNTVLIGLPRPHNANYVLPGPIYLRGTGSIKGPDEGSIPIRSSNKRLSGVIIGDSVRALLEITTTDAAAGQGGGQGGGQGEGGGAAGAATIVRVVQPGDEVDGIKILRIERVFEGGRQITRMFVREGNEERFVDLRPSPTPPAAAGAGFGSEGGSSSPGGSSAPGSPFGAIRPSPGGFPRGSRPQGP